MSAEHHTHHPTTEDHSSHDTNNHWGDSHAETVWHWESHTNAHRPDSHEIKGTAGNVTRDVTQLLSLWDIGAKTQGLKNALSWALKNVWDSVTAILELVKETWGHFASAYSAVEQEKTTAGKIAYSLVSVAKIPLETMLSIWDFFRKQWNAFSNMVANFTSWKRIPAPVANIIRAPLVGLGWLLTPFRLQEHKGGKEAHAHH